MAFLSDLVEFAHKPRWLIACGVLVVAVVVIAVLGGFHKVPALPSHHYHAGQRATGHALAITLQRAWVTSRTLTGTPQQFTGHNYLLVDAIVENRTHRPISNFLATDLRWLAPGKHPTDGPAGITSQKIVHADDHSFLMALQPGLPTHVLLIWELKPGQRLPHSLDWTLRDRRFKQHTFLTTESAWLPTTAFATFTLPVADRRPREAQSP